jgi:hypothetical protein
MVVSPSLSESLSKNERGSSGSVTWASANSMIGASIRATSVVSAAEEVILSLFKDGSDALDKNVVGGFQALGAPVLHD